MVAHSRRAGHLEGPGSLYETRPKNPVDFLGSEWLLSYAKEQKLYKDEKAHKLLVKELRKKHEDHLDKEEQERKKEAKKQDKKEEEVQDFYKKLDRSDDFYDLLQEFTEFLQLNTSTPARPPESTSRKWSRRRKRLTTPPMRTHISTQRAPSCCATGS